MSGLENLLLEDDLCVSLIVSLSMLKSEGLRFPVKSGSLGLCRVDSPYIGSKSDVY
jgi:hypothetical protein